MNSMISGAVGLVGAIVGGAPGRVFAKGGREK